ncbi:MAG: type I DNA topoisomerase [bacterium]|nr:MAG: type I DNA topoisomerase [bacterium]
MEQVLVVVESPAKARTIKKYLGDGYKVKASIGHIRDLPKRELGIDVEHGFTPTFVTIRGKSKVINDLRKEVKRSSEILLATDMDREGEAIAWHLQEVFDEASPPIKRIIFNEITKKALQEAIAHPLDIDMNKVNAQLARRVLDRLVGYKVSPVLWKIFYKGLSAGRVQSVGLRLVNEREEEIRSFVPKEYWTIEGRLAKEKGEEFEARLFKVDDRKPDIATEAEAKQLLAEIRKAPLAVDAVRHKDKKRNPQPPFITSTMQRDAASRLGFSAKKTMVIAQQLYEGVVLGDEGSVGLISYMRTDSTRVSDEAYRQGCSYIETHYGKETCFKGKRSFKKAKSSQDAHEAIRPTDCHREPSSIRRFLNKDQLALYELVWRRFLASLAAPAVYETKEVDISAGTRFLLRAGGRKIKFAGFLQILPDKKSEKEVWLPELEKGDPLSIIHIDSSQHFTEPPPRYTEASLIKELEDKGIGRPSTYANIISIIQTRDYVKKERGTLYPTELGEKVWNTLAQLFRDIFEIDFTVRMESELDKVEEAQEDWRDVVTFFYKPLMADLEQIKGKHTRFKQLIQEETEEICENCGKKLVKKWSRNGPFLACPGFPECRYTRSLEGDDQIDRQCPQCGGRLTYRRGRFGRFIACQNYPTCKFTETVTLGVPCPVEGCDGEIIERRTKRGKIFYGCSRYPKCSYASWDKPTSQRCPECGTTYLVEKESKKKGHYLKCTHCKFEVTL